MKKIKILATGGTISAHHANRVDFRNYISGHYSCEDITKEIPEIHDIASIEIEQLANFSSTVITSSHWLQLRKRINQCLNNEGYDGIVITHGTNTLEETAYFLHLTMDTEKPIVLTGAQRPLSGLSSDAHINLLNAVKVASSKDSYGKGVLVALNDQISSARDVAKTNTYRLETFQSGQLGFLGYIDPDNTVQFYRAPTRTHTIQSKFSKLEIKELPTVEIVYSYAGANGNIISSLINTTTVDGIIVAGTGAGRCSPEEELALKQARDKGIQVIMSSRVENGRVVPIEKYEYLEAPTADNLSPQKARILLMVALLKYTNYDDLQAVFDQY
ncbi:asparaginase [Sporosarcina sp. 6E9]|uniref:asparaginase n=1 Tax=Sporosarcina sp. 6E9 TaxID=2819235 RepID=UPI001B30BF66|nr:asparaginase [Sporosarcina sp. 6E9]